jgi:hypothetical protein
VGKVSYMPRSSRLGAADQRTIKLDFTPPPGKREFGRSRQRDVIPRGKTTLILLRAIGRSADAGCSSGQPRRRTQEVVGSASERHGDRGPKGLKAARR